MECETVIDIIQAAVDNDLYVNIRYSQSLEKYEVEIGYDGEDAPIAYAYNLCIESAMYQIQEDLSDFGIKL